MIVNHPPCLKFRPPEVNFYPVSLLQLCNEIAHCATGLLFIPISKSESNQRATPPMPHPLLRVNGPRVYRPGHPASPRAPGVYGEHLLIFLIFGAKLRYMFKSTPWSPPGLTGQYLDRPGLYPPGPITHPPWPSDAFFPAPVGAFGAAWGWRAVEIREDLRSFEFPPRVLFSSRREDTSPIRMQNPFGAQSALRRQASGWRAMRTDGQEGYHDETWWGDQSRGKARPAPRR